MNQKLNWIEKYYQKIEIKEKNLIQELLDYLDLKQSKELIIDDISKLIIKTDDIKDGFEIDLIYKNLEEDFFFPDLNIMMEYLLDKKLINIKPKKLILSKMNLFDRRIKDMVLLNIDKDLSDSNILIILDNNTLNNPELLNKQIDFLITFGFQRENIYVLDFEDISKYKDLELDLIYVDDFNIKEIISNLKETNYLKTLNDYINLGVIYLGLKNGIDLVEELNIKIKENIDKDDILVIYEDDYVKYELKEYKGFIEKKRGIENFKKIVEDLSGEPEINLKTEKDEYYIIKYKDYITFQDKEKNEIPFKNIDELLEKTNLKTDWNKIISIIVDEYRDL